MQIALQSPLRRILFAIACCSFAAYYVEVCVREYRATLLAADSSRASLEKAIALEPANAQYRELLARYLALSGANIEEAVSTYRTAAELNPYDARCWLDLAGAYEVEGRVDEQEQSVEHAVAADPHTPDIAWEAANLFLVQGNQKKALGSFREVLANDPWNIDAALQMCWRATGNVDQVVGILPPKPDAYLSFVRLLSSRGEVGATESVWNHLLALRQPFPIRLSFPYFRFLFAKQEVAAASDGWRQLASLNPSLQPYLPTRDNLVVNGGFERPILNGGFDWWYQANPHVTLQIDSSEFYSGTRSLSVTFDGQTAAEAGLSQLISVKPNTEYDFSAAYRAEELDTASGPRFSLSDPYTGSNFVLTDDIVGSNPWRSQEAEFRTGPDTKLLLLRIVRQPADPLIRGQLWVDDFKLIEK
jgi:tetratricopeptide (TPR) repeat protein